MQKRTFSIWWSDISGKHHDTKYVVSCENDDSYMKEVKARESMIQSGGGTIIMIRTNTLLD